MTFADAWMPGDRLIPFSSLEALVASFRSILASTDAQIPPGSELDGLCSLTVRLARGELSERERHETGVIRRVGGFLPFLEKVVDTAGHPSFSALSEHFKLLANGDFTLNETSNDSRGPTPKLFELLMALSVLRIGTNVEVDDPERSSKGRNPDVLTDIDGQRWGIACKVLYGSSGKTLHDAVEKGIDQVQKSPAAAGVVVVNINNLVDYAAILRDRDGTIEPWPSLEQSLSLMHASVDKKRQQLVDEIDVDYLTNTLFHGKKAWPVIVLYAHAATAVKSAIAPYPLPTLLRFLSAIPLGEAHGATFILDRLNRSLQDVLKLAANPPLDTTDGTIENV
ncbi:MAG: hypothetical protein IT169_20200 [Bryobacterales bacterium]|nr:hypothetical protein [Bryobacterales bacterium]